MIAVVANAAFRFVISSPLCAVGAYPAVLLAAGFDDLPRIFQVFIRVQGAAFAVVLVCGVAQKIHRVFFHGCFSYFLRRYAAFCTLFLMSMV
jgi:hypothetical protein